MEDEVHMENKVGFRIVPDWERPSAKLLAEFGQASSSQVADVMLRFGALDSGIRPVWKSPRVIGAALTVWCRSADKPHDAQSTFARSGGRHFGRQHARQPRQCRFWRVDG